jgi:hypothetical protein
MLEFIVDGNLRDQKKVNDVGSSSWDLDGSEDPHWCHSILRERDGNILALTNPIFLDGRN